MTIHMLPSKVCSDSDCPNMGQEINIHDTCIKSLLFFDHFTDTKVRRTVVYLFFGIR